MRRFTWPMRWWLVAFLLGVALLSYTGLFVGSVLLGDWERRILEPEEFKVRMTREWQQWGDPAWQASLAGDLAQLGMEAELTDSTGRVIFRSTPIPPPLQATGTSPQGTGYDRRWAEHREVFHNGAAVGRAVVAYRWNPMIDDRGVFWPGLWLTLGVVLGSVLLISVAGIWLLSRIFLTPLRHLAAAAEQVQQGNLDFSLPPARVREVGRVLDGFRRMASSLKESIGRQAAMEEERRFFLAAVSHDLRTPLFSLRGRLEGIRDGLAATPEQVNHYLQSALDRVAGLELLVADLFAYARLNLLEQAPAREPVNLGDLLRQSIEAAQVAATAKGIVITPVPTAEPCRLTGDPHLLGRAVDNLLSNALRHTPPGGRVEVGWRRRGALAEVWVADTGEGIPPDVMPRLFSPLFRGEPSRSRHTGGAGLGLVIARRVLEAHGGTLTAENRLEGGARFNMRIPLSAD